ncbi:Rho-binding antiterminator [Luteimonas composti]|uniref:Rho-binding antiterminator n=1 Tax=Luteimonas composti TaxID=398257 RepID=A0ABT6MTE4_9GAMM|nr:Rho-binding antiterminator [Luteimonas composti]MDH7453904.1 Rho-binding antiterminator [Luteimonas composti]
MSYHPISCDFHDVLEAIATRRGRVRIEFRSDQGLQAREARIVDLGHGSDGEYMTLDTGESVRLDRIVSVDGITLAPPGQLGGDDAAG